MNKKQEMWVNTLEKIDEKYIKEAAEFAAEGENSEFNNSLAKKSMRGSLSPKKSGNLMFVIAAAAAVVCCTIGAGFFLGRENEISVEPSVTTTPVAVETTPSEMPAEEKPLLTLDNVRELAKKGANLTWSDFEQFEGKDVGHGLYIRYYQIDDEYGVYVGGTHPDEKPWYVRLHRESDDSNYSLLENGAEGLEEFLGNNRPTLLAEKISYKAENIVDKEKIERALWEHCDYDYTKANSYSLAVEQEFVYPSPADIKKKELGHQYLYLSTDYKYIGTEQTDWLCIVNYQTDVVVPSLLYSEIVLIKDNEITERIYKYENSRINDVIFSEGEYFMTTIVGLYKLHPEIKTAKPLISDSYGRIIHIDGGFIIYGGENVWIYNRKTGEITKTDINYSTYGSRNYEIRFRENRLEYVDKDTEKGMVYDLETGGIYEDESLEFYNYAENDEYIVVPDINDYEYSAITVTRKSDGLSKTFDVSEIAEKTGYKSGFEFVGEWVAFSENRIFLYPQNANCWYALNFETEEAAICDFTGYDFLYYSSEADCFYSDTRELTAVIKPDEAHFTVSTPVSYEINSSDIIITTYFGYDAWREGGHSGIDISWDGCYGSPVYAAANGTVTAVQTEYDDYGMGMYVVIDHRNGYTTLYSHCSEILVKAGDTVHVGDMIAQIGSTGFSTGPHLHFELQRNHTPVDPMQYIK